jgi:hypothetical protein
MSRRFVSLSFAGFVLLLVALTVSFGCEGGPPYGSPLYIKPGEDPFAQAGLFIKSIAVEPQGVNLAVSGVQKFRAYAHYNNGTTEEISNKVEWYTETPAVVKIEPGTSKFFGQKPGIAIVRCRIRQAAGFAISNAAFLNVFNPNQDNPPAVPLNPGLIGTPEGVLVSWDINVTDNDLAGYNVYRTRVSTSHYSLDISKTQVSHYASDARLNEQPILYPPYLDKTVVAGWYYYRVTAEDLLGLQSAPSQETSIFVTAQVHYGGAYDADMTTTERDGYKDAFSTAFDN